MKTKKNLVKKLKALSIKSLKIISINENIYNSRRDRILRRIERIIIDYKYDSYHLWDIFSNENILNMR